MKMVCSNCDIGLKRSDCDEHDYIECECRRWMIEALKHTTIDCFINNALNDALEKVYDNKEDQRNAKILMIAILSKGALK